MKKMDDLYEAESQGQEKNLQKMEKKEYVKPTLFSLGIENTQGGVFFGLEENDGGLAS